jgi:hypothetical protein
MVNLKCHDDVIESRENHRSIGCNDQQLLEELSTTLNHADKILERLEMLHQHIEADSRRFFEAVSETDTKHYAKCKCLEPCRKGQSAIQSRDFTQKGVECCDDSTGVSRVSLVDFY